MYTLNLFYLLPFFQIDETGCPAVFKKKCKCGPQKYQYWKPDEDVRTMACFIKILQSIISDAPACGVTYDHHSNDICAPVVITYAPREYLKYRRRDRQNIFQVLATGLSIVSISWKMIRTQNLYVILGVANLGSVKANGR
jgi:hypothetical protein